MTELNINYFSDDKMKVGKAALLLVLASNRQEETEIKAYLKERYDYKTVVTEVGGVLKDVKDKVIKAVVNASLNAAIIDKNSSHIHPLIHATLEAERGMMFDMPAESSVAMKVTIVVGPKWLAVAMYGDSAIHFLSNHERVGLGIMHL